MSQLWQFAIVGLAGGSAYALMALGVVAVYRGSGILNFSQGAIGMIASYSFWEVYDGGNGSLPEVPAFLVGIAVGIALGLLFYVLVVRFLRNVSDMAKVVATLGLMLLLESAAEKGFGTLPHLVKPLFGSGKITLFGAVMTYGTLFLLVITIAIAVALYAIFHRTKLGLNATALQENPVAAGAIGISPHLTGIVTWAVGGATAAIAGILLIPVIGLTPSALTLLVIPAMASALIGRFNLILPALLVGLFLGIVESVLGGDWSVNSGIVASVPFAVIIVAIVLGGRALPGRGESFSVRLPAVGDGRIKPVKGVLLVVIGVILALEISPTWSTAMISSCVFGLMALSMVVVTGYAGQISVASAAFAGFGSFIAARTSSDVHFPFLVCILFGTIAAVLLGLVFGAPAVRVRGVNLAIVTLGLSLAVEDMVLTEPSLTGGVDGLGVASPSLFGLQLSPASHPDRFAVVCVVALAIGALVVLNVRRGESGRRYVAVRANERGAASVGVSVAGAKLGAFAISAALAGLGGALATFQFNVADFSSYDVFSSITALAFAVVAGIGFVGGAIAAGVSSQGGMLANFVMNVLHWTTINDWLTIITGAFVMQIMIQYPDGAILAVVHQVRFIRRNAEKVVSRVPVSTTFKTYGRRTRGPKGGLVPDTHPGALPAVPGIMPGEVVLSARGISVRYGNVKAVDDVSFELKAGRIVGVLGPNGAGKTSLIDALTGFNRMSGGRIELSGRDITSVKAHGRARLGIGRTFQNLELFDDLTVLENILTGLDTHRSYVYATDLVRPKQGELDDTARAAISMLGLEEDLNRVVADLPQGRRRMAAIARLVAQQPQVILLDEPAAGLNGAERRTASKLFRTLADQLGAAVLLVEHNVDVVAATCDELIVLDFGRVIASGAPEEVLRDPMVRQAYLGQSMTDGSSTGSRPPQVTGANELA